MKVEDVVTVRGPVELTFCVPTVKEIGPVAAPGGMTNETVPAVEALTGALIVAPPCPVSVTWGTVPLTPPRLLPLIVTTVPIGPEAGEKLEIVGAGDVIVAVAVAVAVPPPLPVTVRVTV